MKTNTIYLSHILDETTFIPQTTATLTYETFKQNPLIQKAIIRSLEIIGEATKNISREYRDEHPEIPWKTMAGLRDRLIHAYFSINITQVWEVITDDIPLLHIQIQKLLSTKTESQS